MTKSKTKTAAELLAELGADPGFLERQREQEKARQKMDADLRSAEAPLVTTLGEMGVKVRSVWDLAAQPGAHPRVLPILIEHLQRPYPERVREGIARALAVPQAATVWPALLQSFQSEEDSSTTGVKWALACALAEAMTDDVLEDVIELIRDPRHSGNRTAFFDRLARSSDPRAKKALIDAGADPELADEVRRVLRRQIRTVASARTPRWKGTPTGLSEVSLNCDSRDVEPFLQRIERIVAGFGKEEITRVVSLVENLAVEDEDELHFEVNHEGQRTPLNVAVFMSDIDTPDLYFMTTPKLAAALDNLARTRDHFEH